MKTWKFRLTYNGSNFDFTAAMVKGWDDISLALQRNSLLRGALFQYSNVFQFIGKAKDFVQQCVDNGGIEAAMYQQIYEGNESGHAGSFVKRGTPLKASFKTYDNNGTIAKLTFAISGFEEKLFNRIDTNIEYGISEAVDGEVLDAPKYKFSRMPDQVIVGDAEVILDETQINVLATSDNQPVIFPNIGVITSIKFSSIQEVNASYNIDWPPAVAIYHKALQRSRVRLVIKDLLLSFNKVSGTTFNCVRAFFIHKLDANMNIIIPNINTGYYYDSNTNTTSAFNINEDLIIDLEQGESIAFRLTVEFIAPTIGNGWSYHFANNGNVSIVSQSFFQETVTNCILPHEAIERIISQITGKKDALVSNFFGRTELGYTVDGKGAYCALLNGLLIRSFPTDLAKQTFSLKELLDNFIKIYNLVAWINDEKLYIEEYKDAYDLNRIIKIEKHGGVTVNLIESMHVANLKYGYINQEYEEASGLNNINGQYERQTHIQTTKNALNLTVSYRADPIGIELSRRLPYVTNPKFDYRNDKDTFIVLCKKGNGSEIVPILGAEYGTIEGLINSATVYNIGLTPRTILKNWDNVISSGLYLYPQKFIKFVKGPNNSDLIVNGVAERANIEVSTLSPPLFLPYNLMVKEAIMTASQLDYLRQYPNSIIEVGGYYGMVDELDTKLNTGKTNMKLIRANR